MVAPFGAPAQRAGTRARRVRNKRADWRLAILMVDEMRRPADSPDRGGHAAGSDVARSPDKAGRPAEITARGLILGALITCVFAAANVFMGLRTGVTFSSSIPAAVISMGCLRVLGGGGILENNMVQTQASAAGTLCNVLLVLPGLAIVGAWHGFPFWQTMLVCLLGGWLGVMYSIPLRRTLVIESKLPYPEGVAAAEVLWAGHPDHSDADGDAREQGGLSILGVGAAAASLVSFASGGLKLLADSATAVTSVGGAVFRIGTGFSLALLGVGYLVGIAACLSLLLGVVLAWGILVPWLTAGVHPAHPGGADALALGVWMRQVRMVGAGIIGVGGLWSVVSLSGPMAAGLRSAFAAARQRKGGGQKLPRNERDIPITWVAIIAASLSLPLAALYGWFAAPGLSPFGNAFLAAMVAGAAIFTLVFGFLMATACGYMAGLLGSSSSPISGIAILSTVLVALPLSALLAGHGSAPQTARVGVAFSLFVTAVVVTISSIANDNLQDLKTGALVDATPWRQQAVLLLGVAAGALAIAPVLQLLYTTYGFTGAMPHPGMDAAQALPAPQASLVAGITQGIFDHKLPWTMVLTGVAAGVVLILLDRLLQRRGLQLPVLTVGIGVYLPPTVGVTIAVGGVIGWLAQRSGDDGKLAEQTRRRGVLLVSGFLVGESLMGVLLTVVQSVSGRSDAVALAGPGFAGASVWLGGAVFVVCAGVFYGFLKRK